MSNYQDNVRKKGEWQTNLREDNILKPPKVIVWDFRDREKLDTFWFSDVHLGHAGCDEEKFLRDVDHVRSNEIPFMDLGDLIENSTRDSVGAGVYEQAEIAEEQIERAIEHYWVVKDLIMGMQPGNHELRTWNKSGVNLTRVIANRLSARYAGFGVMHYVMVGDQRYTGYSQHGGSGEVTTAGKFNALKRAADIFECDFLVSGHTHEAIFHARDRFFLDRKDKTVRKRTQYMVNNGAYLNWWGSYGQIKSYSPSEKKNAQVSFDGTKRNIEVIFR